MSWARLRSLYEAALDCEPSQRLDFLSAQSPAHPQLVDQVRNLLQIQEASSSFLEAPLYTPDSFAAPSLFQPGDVVASRFRIVRHIGRGGMGDVYEAESATLAPAQALRHALKVVRADFWDNPAHQQRLHREASLASRIEPHPNVCRVFETVTHPHGSSHLPVLVMELLEGETLAALLARRKLLPWQQASGIALQLASALSAAHHIGVVHRDLKPSNIILAGEDRAVVTDFGLAALRQSPAASPSTPSLPPLTQSGHLLGTLEYMSPEQCFGHPVGPPSDIYSLGIILYEMLTGQRPGQRATLVEEILNRLTNRHPNPSALVPGLPAFLDQIVLRCLQPDPQDRWLNPDQIVAALRQRSVPLASRWSRRQIARFAARGTAALASTAAVAGIAAYWGSLRPGTGLNMPLLVVEDNPQAQPIRTLFQRQLEQSPIVKVWNQGATWAAALAAAKLPADASPTTLTPQQWLSLCRGIKATYLLRIRLAWRLINLELIPVDNPASAQSRQFSLASITDPGQAVGEAARWTRSYLGESDISIASHDRPPYLVTSASTEAIALFDQAEAIREDRPNESVSLLKQAVRLDPSFALAYMRLGDLQVATQDFPNGLSNWQKSVQLANEGRLTAREAHRIQTMYNIEIEDWSGAEASALAWSAAFPAELRPLWEIFNARLALGRISEAEKMIHPMSLIPDSSRYFNLADALIAMWNKDYQRMEQSGVKLREAGSWLQGQRFVIVSHALRGDFSRALQLAQQVQQAAKLPQEASRSFVLLAALHEAAGSLEEARKALLAGLDFDLRKGFEGQSARKHLGLAYLAWLRNEYRETAVHASLAILHGDPITMPPHCVALLFRSGHHAAAARARGNWDLQASLDLPRFQTLRDWMTGEELLANSDTNGLGFLKRFAARLDRTRAPEPLIYGLSKVGESSLAKELAASLIRHPAPLWYSPDTSAAGMIYYCRLMADKN
jgi:tetratricopeptide (TPR) repeat protein